MKKTCMPPILKTVLIVIVVCVVLSPLIWTAIGVIVVGTEDVAYKNELDNPYINADYKGWHTVELINEETILLPNEWDIKTTDSITVITDEHGKDIARCGNKDVDYETLSYQCEQLLGELLGYSVSVETVIQEKSVRASEYGTITIADDSATQYNYIFLSKANPCDMLFVFEPTARETHNDLIEILEAMVFSYVFR